MHDNVPIKTHVFKIEKNARNALVGSRPERSLSHIANPSRSNCDINLHVAKKSDRV